MTGIVHRKGLRVRALVSTGQAALRPLKPSQLRTGPKGWAPAAIVGRPPGRETRGDTTRLSRLYPRNVSMVAPRRDGPTITGYSAGGRRVSKSIDRPAHSSLRSFMGGPHLRASVGATKVRGDQLLRIAALATGGAAQPAARIRPIAPHLAAATKRSHVSPASTTPDTSAPRARVSTAPPNVRPQRQRSRAILQTASRVGAAASVHNGSRRPSQWAPPGNICGPLGPSNGDPMAGTAGSAARAPPGAGEEPRLSEPTDASTANSAWDGELILDSAELGAWMTRHLTEALSVAGTGTTGPDARMAPTPPGSAPFF